MENINNLESLKKSILILELQQLQEEQVLKIELQRSFEKIKPLNFIKNTLNEAVHDPEIQQKLINTSLGLAVGFITQKIIVRKSENPLVKLFGVLIQIAVTTFISRRKKL